MEIAQFLPAGVEPAAAIGMIAASFAGSFITAAFGIGGGVFLLAVLASLMPPPALIPVHGVVEIGSNTVRAAMLLRSVFWPALPGFVAGTIGGIALGGLVVVDLPAENVIRAAVALFILWSVFSRPPAWLRRWPALAGAVSSFLTMFFGATGPFVASYVRAFSLDRHAHVATHAAAMTVQHLLKVAAFAVLGFAFAAWVPLISAMILAGALGTGSGRLALNRQSNAGFHKVLNVLLLLIAARLLAQAAGLL